MANSALIEDLRKQFAENPRRVFARLANEYRKSGDLDVATRRCVTGLAGTHAHGPYIGS